MVDLGCGTGMLSIGAALLGAGHVLGIDADEDALDIARENLDEYEGMPVDLLCARVESVSAGMVSVDTVITNPPFGTRSKGADMEFLRAAFRISKHCVYSLHKTSTRAYIGKYARNVLGALSAEPVAQLKYDLPASYSFHRMASKDIDVDVWRFEVPDDDDAVVS